MTSWIRKYWLFAVAILIVAGGTYVWSKFKPADLPAGFASSNGRIEAVEIDIATKTAGRIKEILVDEGDFVTAGQLIAYMDTDQLQAHRREATAHLLRAEIAVETAQSLVVQREAERMAAAAVVEQRNAELVAANQRLARSEQLMRSNTVSRQVLDDDRAKALGATAAVGAARAQLAATAAAIGAAKSQVIDARAAIDAAKATIERIDVDIADSALKAPRDGRVQHRVAQPGEVLAAGGRVLNILDLADVYMTFFLPTAQAGRVAIGAEVRLVLDAAPQYVIPARASFVADVAQFTPKTVETEEERQKLTFRVKAQIPTELLQKYIQQVKTGLPGVAYVRLDPQAEWPPKLRDNLLQ